MYIYELRCFDKAGQCFRVDHIGAERDALAKFDKYKNNTIKSHIALNDVGLQTNCLAEAIELVMYDDNCDWQFAQMCVWQLHRNQDGMIVENY